MKADDQANIDDTLSINLTAVGGRVGSAGTQKTGDTYLPPRNASAYETVTRTQTKSSL